MAYTWQHQLGRETCGSHGPLQCLRIAFRRDNRVKQWSGSLLGLDYNSSWGSQEPIESGFRVDMAYTWQHQLGRETLGSLGPLQCLRIVFGMDNRVKQWFGSLLRLDYNSSWGSQEPIEDGFRVNMACILHHQYGRVAWGSFEHF